MDRIEKIEIKDLRIASLRYYSEENRGVEVDSPLGWGCFAFLVKIGKDTYVNPFNPLEEYPVFKRVPYSNTTMSGEDFGTKIMLANNILREGPCYVLSDDDYADYFGCDVIDIKVLEECILNSPGYFRERKGIAEARFKKHPIKMYKILKNDEEMEDVVNKFFAKRGVELQKVR